MPPRAWVQPALLAASASPARHRGGSRFFGQRAHRVDRSAAFPAMQGFNRQVELKGKIEAADPAAQKTRLAGSGERRCFCHLVSPGRRPAWKGFRALEAQSRQGGGKAVTGGDAPEACRSLISLGFLGIAHRDACQMQCQLTATDDTTRGLGPCCMADLQGFACVSRGLAGIHTHWTNRQGVRSLAGH